MNDQNIRYEMALVRDKIDLNIGEKLEVIVKNNRIYYPVCFGTVFNLSNE